MILNAGPWCSGGPTHECADARSAALTTGRTIYAGGKTAPGVSGALHGTGFLPTPDHGWERAGTRSDGPSGDL